MKNMEMYNNLLLLSSQEISSILKKTVHKELEKTTTETAILFLFEVLSKSIVKVPFKFTKQYSQNLTCICKINHILLECPTAT